MSSIKPYLILILASLLLSNTAMAEAQPAPAIAGASSPKSIPVSATRLILLGTGGGPPIRTRRSETASLLVVDGKVYLIDAGAGTLQRLHQAGFTAQDIDGIFITHNHLDHNAGLAEIIAYSATANRKTPVTIFGPTGVREMVAASLAFATPSKRIFSAQGLVHAANDVYVVSELTADGQVYADHAVTVDAVVNNHFRLTDPDSESAKIDKSFSYRFTTPHGSVVFTGDTGPDERLTEFARGADVLVSEVVDVDAAIAFAIRSYNVPQSLWARTREHMATAHLTPVEVGKMAGRAKVGMVILNHFTPGSDEETSTVPYVAGIRDYYVGPVIAGMDLFEYDLLDAK